MKKKWLIGFGVAAAAFGMGGWLFLHVSAAGVLTGLEEKVTEKVEAKQVFRLVEIIPDGAPGKLEYMVNQPDRDIAKDIMDAYQTEYLPANPNLKNVPQTRKNYVASYEKNRSNEIGMGVNYPVSKNKAYQEAYFPADIENWKVLEFAKEYYETVDMKGIYQRDEENGTYTQNITGFRYNQEGGEYKVTFTDTMRTDTEEAVYRQPYRYAGVDEAGNPIYMPAEESADIPIEEKADPPVEENVDVQAEENAGIPIEENINPQVEEDAGVSVEENINPPVEGDAGVSVEENINPPVEENADVLPEEITEELPEENGTAEIVYIDSIQYMGTESGEACYEAVLDEQMPYYYDAENGKYRFVLDGTAEKKSIQVGRIYYKYELASNDWFRTKVLQSKDSDSLMIETVSIEESALEENKEAIDSADFIYIGNDEVNSKNTFQDKTKVWEMVASAVTGEKMVPCVIKKNTMVWKECGDDYIEGCANDTGWHFVRKNLYITYENIYRGFDNSLYGKSVVGTSEVEDFIKADNLLRAPGEKLVLHKVFLFQYIIDYGRQRKSDTKESYHVLQIQPADAVSEDTAGFKLTKEAVLSWAGAEEGTEVVIDSMSIAEFIGKEIDIDNEYDLLYIGACIDSFNTEGSGSERHTVFNDSRLNGLIYMHTGDYVAGNMDIAGMMDVDYGGAYAFRDSEPRPYARNAEYTTQLGNTYQGYLLHNNGGAYTAARNRTVYVDGVLRQNFKKPYPTTQYSYASIIPLQINSTTEEYAGDLMIYRYSGNDLTPSKYENLKNISIPVVVSDVLCAKSKTGANISNAATVDNASYIGHYLDTGKDNIFTVSQAENSTYLRNYVNRNQKRQILYFDPDHPGEPEPYIAKYAESGSLFSEGQTWVKVDTGSSESGYYTVKIGFCMDGEIEQGKKWRPTLYLDMDGDGDFATDTTTDRFQEKISGVVYNADTGEELAKDNTGYYFTEKVRCRFEGKIPAVSRNMLAWKLKIKCDNKSVSDVHYTALNSGEAQNTVKVLQITSQNAKGESNNLIDLSTEEKIQKYLEETKAMTGLNFEIDTIGGYDFGNTSATSADEFYEMPLPGLDSSLSEYDMLVVGFAHQYYDLYNSEIPNSKYAADAINRCFIYNGKSVIFSHDTTSFVNISPNHPDKDVHLTGFSDDWEVPQQWGCYMNNAFRCALAMDRYGVTADTDSSRFPEAKWKGYLRQQQHLTVSRPYAAYSYNAYAETTVNEGLVHTYDNDAKYEDDSSGSSPGYFLTRNQKSGEVFQDYYDIAYAANTYTNQNKVSVQAYGQTHGFTNATLNAHLVEEQKYLHQFHKEGGKWAQYLNLRNDLLPATEAGRDGIVKANVTQENDGLITHYPYEIGSEFTSAKTHHQYYQLNLETDRDRSKNGDVHVWYCLSGDAENPSSDAGKVYSSSKNDARNNYYLYTRGNVTYIGVGHSALDHSGKDLETKLLVNAMVNAASSAQFKDPEIKILETADPNSAEIKYAYLITRKDGTTTEGLTTHGGDTSFYFKVSDPNLIPAKSLNLRVSASYISGGKQQSIPIYSLIDCETGKTVSSSDLKNGHVYYMSFYGNNYYKFQEEWQVELKVVSKFGYYRGFHTGENTTTLTVLKSTLFELN